MILEFSWFWQLFVTNLLPIYQKRIDNNAINRNFDNLVPNYLFAEVASRTNKYMQEHPDKKVIKLGIGDVTLPLAPVVIEAMKKGAEDPLAHKDTFKGYPIMRAMHSSERLFLTIMQVLA